MRRKYLFSTCDFSLNSNAIKIRYWDTYLIRQANCSRVLWSKVQPISSSYTIFMLQPLVVIRSTTKDFTHLASTRSNYPLPPTDWGTPQPGKREFEAHKYKWTKHLDWRSMWTMPWIYFAIYETTGISVGWFYSWFWGITTLVALDDKSDLAVSLSWSMSNPRVSWGHQDSVRKRHGSSGWEKDKVGPLGCQRRRKDTSILLVVQPVCTYGWPHSHVSLVLRRLACRRRSLQVPLVEAMPWVRQRQISHWWLHGWCQILAILEPTSLYCKTHNKGTYGTVRRTVVGNVY